MEVGDKGYEVMKASKNDKCKKETGVEMIDFNIDMNPNRIDMKNYNPDQEAMKHMEFMAQFPATKPLSGFPEGMDIEVGEIVELQIPDTGYEYSSCKIYYPKGEGPFPVLFCIHGGAFFGGWQFLDEPFCRQI